MPRRNVTIRNEFGLHARPATRFVEQAQRFNCDVWLSHADRRADGKSIMGLLTLAAVPGMEVQLETQGPDAEEALRSLGDLIDDGFGEAET
ncbi:MAG: HPr family phosphocarrier protein [Xanthomonadales bacterium]|nr:HPr family phosphocarrier protein [Xanthomonadales bacterium]